MQTEFIAEPIMSIDERLLGVELLTRFSASHSWGWVLMLERGCYAPAFEYLTARF